MGYHQLAYIHFREYHSVITDDHPMAHRFRCNDGGCHNFPQCCPICFGKGMCSHC